MTLELRRARPLRRVRELGCRSMLTAAELLGRVQRGEVFADDTKVQYVHHVIVDAYVQLEQRDSETKTHTQPASRQARQAHSEPGRQAHKRQTDTQTDRQDRRQMDNEGMVTEKAS